MSLHRSAAVPSAADALEASEPVPDVSVPRTPSTSQRWIAPIALVIAVIAIGIAGWALVNSRGGEPGVDGGQSEAAKGQVCAAFDLVRNAVILQTNADLGSNPVAQEAVAANARLATVAGGEYLLSRLDPATPAELTAAVRTFARSIADVGMNQLVGRSNTDPDVVAVLNEAQGASEQVTILCQ